MGPTVWKLLGAGAALLAAEATRRALEQAWKAAFGRVPPRHPESPETEWVEAIAWAMVSGAVIGTVRMVATRKAAGYYQKSAGHLPKVLDD